jgi:hypothetical protein
MSLFCRIRFYWLPTLPKNDWKTDDCAQVLVIVPDFQQPWVNTFRYVLSRSHEGI